MWAEARVERREKRVAATESKRNESSIVKGGPMMAVEVVFGPLSAAGSC